MGGVRVNVTAPFDNQEPTITDKHEVIKDCVLKLKRLTTDPTFCIAAPQSIQEIAQSLYIGLAVGCGMYVPKSDDSSIVDVVQRMIDASKTFLSTEFMDEVEKHGAEVIQESLRQLSASEPDKSGISDVVVIPVNGAHIPLDVLRKAGESGEFDAKTQWQIKIPLIGKLMSPPTSEIDRELMECFQADAEAGRNGLPMDRAENFINNPPPGTICEQIKKFKDKGQEDSPGMSAEDFMPLSNAMPFIGKPDGRVH